MFIAPFHFIKSSSKRMPSRDTTDNPANSSVYNLPNCQGCRFDNHDRFLQIT